MEWLGDLLGAAAGVASGGLFGLFGAVIGQVSKYFQEKQRQAWQEKKWDYEERMQNLQMQARAQETEQELAIVAQEGSWSALQASVQAEGRINASPWANNIRSLFRPFLTVALVALSAWVFDSMISQMSRGDGLFASLFTNEEMRELLKYMVQTIFFTSSTAALWWFAERALTAPWAKK